MALFPPEFLARLERLAVRARRPAGGLSWGRGKGQSSGSGIEFVDLREYSPGDDLRAVDWNLYARLDKLLLRVFRQDREHDVRVILDVSSSMAKPDADKWTRAVRIAGAIAFVGLARMDRVAVWPVVDGSRALSTPFPLAGGKRRAAPLFRWLASLEPSGRTDLGAAAELFAKQVPRGVVVVVSDLYDLAGEGRSGAREGLARLVRAGFETMAIQVIGREDDAPAASGRLELVDAEGGRTVRGRVGARARRAYAETIAREREAIAQMLVSSGGAFALAPPERDLEDLLLRDLRRAGIVT